MNYEEVFNKLREKYSDEEIAESYLIPMNVSDKEKKEVSEELKKLRFELLRKKSEQEKILSDVMRLRILINNYLEKQPYSENHTFGKYLQEYIRIARKSKRGFAEDIGVHHTRLSRIINNKEEPNIGFIYRLEQHSDKLIPAVLWWKLMIKKQEHFINKDKLTREIESKKVKNILKQPA